MLSMLQTLSLLFGITFILGFFSSDFQTILDNIHAILNPLKPATDDATTGTQESPAAVTAPAPETPKT